MLSPSGKDEIDARRAQERARFAELQAIVEIVRVWFEDAVYGDRKRKPVFRVPDEAGLYRFAQALIIERERLRQKRLAADPWKAKSAARLRVMIRDFKKKATEERRAAAHIGMTMNGRLREIERHIEDFESALQFCTPPSVSPIHVLADAAQDAWSTGIRWNAKTRDWDGPRVPQTKGEDGPLIKVVVHALAFVNENRSVSIVSSVLRGLRK